MILGSATVALLAALSVQGEDVGCSADGKTFKVGDKYNTHGCQLNLCMGNDEWARAPCGLVAVPLGWIHQKEDPSKPYPECCGRGVPPLDIVPDVLDKLEYSATLGVTYDGNLRVDQGNELTPTQVKNPPAIDYTAEPESFYLLCMTDPDAPSRKEPTRREFLHWLVGNIPGNRVSGGEVLAEYVGSGPPKDTGLHRYVFLLYKQPGKLNFDEPRIPRTSAEHRPKFSIRKFAEKYKLGDPVEINVYQAQYDDYVPQVHKQLGFKTN